MGMVWGGLECVASKRPIFPYWNKLRISEIEQKLSYGTKDQLVTDLETH